MLRKERSGRKKVNNIGTVRNGSFIETYSGIRMWPLDPKPDEIDIEDIAHALSLLCRFTGHCRFLYTVGQHSLNVYHILRQLGASPVVQLRGLLHDASEAYISDIAAPTKPHIQGYGEIEHGIEEVIFDKYNINNVSDSDKTLIKKIDWIMVCLEAETLCPHASWNRAEYPHQELATLGVTAPQISEGYPLVTKVVFLEVFEELMREVTGN